MRLAPFRLLIIGLSLAGLCGCGSGRPKTVAVKGTVTYNGDPVEGASVVFFKDEGAPPATGQTDASGGFVLTTFDHHDGAVPGDYVVTVAKMESAPDRTDDGRIPVAAPAVAKPKSLIPIKYSEPKASGLSETVSASGPNEFQFDLTD